MTRDTRRPRHNGAQRAAALASPSTSGLCLAGVNREGWYASLRTPSNSVSSSPRLAAMGSVAGAMPVGASTAAPRERWPSSVRKSRCLLDLRSPTVRSRVHESVTPRSASRVSAQPCYARRGQSCSSSRNDFHPASHATSSGLYPTAPPSFGGYAATPPCPHGRKSPVRPGTSGRRIFFDETRDFAAGVSGVQSDEGCHVYRRALGGDHARLSPCRVSFLSSGGDGRRKRCFGLVWSVTTTRESAAAG